MATISIMYQSNRSFNIPTPGIPRAFDAFSCPRGRAFDHHLQGVGNLSASPDVMLRVALIPRWVDKSWRRQRRQTLMNSKEKIVYSWRIGWKPKAYTSFVLYLKVFKTDLYLSINMYIYQNCFYNINNNFLHSITSSVREISPRSSPEGTCGWGRLNSFSARGGGNLNTNFSKIQTPGGLPGGDVEASIWLVQ